MDSWNEIKTAYQVARLGTVSAAAESLGVHRATVIRHIDALEAELGRKFFQRHIRGYTPTEAGEDLLRVAQATEEQLSQWALRTRGDGIELSGELVITAVEGVTELCVPAMRAFLRKHPKTTIRLLTSTRLFKLEYGEAHIALRVGAQPQEPDNVVRPLKTLEIALYGHRTYIEQYGQPSSTADCSDHNFIGADPSVPKRTWQAWYDQNVPAKRIVFLSTSNVVIEQAVRDGIGLGMLPVHSVHGNPDMIQVMPPEQAWNVHLWAVTHRDLHRSAKVQAMLGLLSAI